MIVTSGGDHRHSAAVLDAIRVRMKALVQLRRSAQRQRPEKCQRDETGDQYTTAACWTRERAHGEAIFRPRRELSKRFLQATDQVKR